MTANAAMGLLAAALAAGNVHLWRWTGTFIEAPLAFAGVIAVLLVFMPLYVGASQRAHYARFWGLGIAIGVLSLLRFECGLLGLGFFVHHLVNDRRHLIGRYACAALGLILPLALWGCLCLVCIRQRSADDTERQDDRRAHPGQSGPGAPVRQRPRTRLRRGVPAACLGAGSFFWRRARMAHWSRRPAAARCSRHSSWPCLPSITSRRTRCRARRAIFFRRWPSCRWRSFRSLRRRGASAGPSVRITAAVIVALQVVMALGITHRRVAPVLAQMNSGYVAAMSAAAGELDQRCAPGEVVLVEFDIGVLSYRHNHRCRIADGGALASPELRGLSIAEKIAAVRPRFVVDSLGAPDRSDITAAVPDAALLWQKEFPSHSVGEPGGSIWCVVRDGPAPMSRHDEEPGGSSARIRGSRAQAGDLRRRRAGGGRIAAGDEGMSPNPDATVEETTSTRNAVASSARRALSYRKVNQNFITQV